jgi:hypothetical protein
MLWISECIRIRETTCGKYPRNQSEEDDSESKRRDHVCRNKAQMSALNTPISTGLSSLYPMSCRPADSGTAAEKSRAKRA